MAGIANVLALLKALGLAAWRDVQSFRSLAGQNFFLFAMLVAYQQAESAEFFFLILAVVMLLPLSADAMDKLPSERRLSWPLSRLEWSAVRIGSLAFNPIAWLAFLLLLRMGWRIGVFAAIGGALLQATVWLAKRFIPSPYSCLRWIPAPPGVIGSIMRLQWREMLGTLDPYLALTLMACTELYRASGKPLAPTVLQIMSLLVCLALSTETQVLFSLDGAGAGRYRQFPLRGWQILLAKDLAYLALLGLLVLPLDFVGGFAGGVTVLAIGHHRSVFQSAAQARWRFTSGSLFPDGAIQVAALFAVGLQVKKMLLPLAGLCFICWLASLFFYGWQWDRRLHVL